MKGKRIAAIALMLVAVIIFPFYAAAADTDSMLSGQYRKSGASEAYSKTPNDVRKALGNMGVAGNDAKSLSKFTPVSVFKYITSTAIQNMKSPLRAAAAVLGVLLACALLGAMKNSFGEKSLDTVFGLVSTLCIAAVLLVPVTKCVSFCARVISDASRVMTAFIPVFAALGTASGHPASAVVFQGLLLTVSQAVSQIAANGFVPMVDMYLAFCVVGAISPGVNIGSIASFMRKIVSFALVLCMTVFTGILTVQSVISQASDNVAAKTAKFVVGSAVPVIGSAVSDAVNTVMSCANLMRSTTGALSLMVFIVMFLPPVIDCLMWMLVADVSVIFADMLGIGQASGLLKAVSEAMRLLTALVFSAALAMIVSVSIMLLTGMSG
jgi:stage III sporulation protein AE